jgi:group I intron endonuclease
MTNNNLMSNISDIFIGLIDVLIILLPVLLAVAFMTLIERKNLAAFQRRTGPNNVGVYGILNPFKKYSKKLLFLALANLWKLDYLIIYFWLFLIYVLIILGSIIVILISLKTHDLFSFHFVISNNNGTYDILPTFLTHVLLSKVKWARVCPASSNSPYNRRFFSTAANESNKTVEDNNKKVEPLNEAINKLEEKAKSKGIELKPLNATPLHSIHNILDVTERQKLYEKLRNTGEQLGGIYAIQYKYNPNIFYIGRAFEFSSRFASHITNLSKDARLFTSNLFYNFVKSAGGWDNFTFHIIEFLPKNIPLQIAQENFYFMKCNPILNTMSSGRYNPKKNLNKDPMSNNKQNNTLETKNKNSRRAKLLWIYKIDINSQFNNKNPELLFAFFGNCLGLIKSSKITGVDRNIMAKFLDSNRILNGYLFYTSAITNFELTLEQVRRSWSIYGSRKSSVKVWCYSKDNQGLFKLVTSAPFDSIREYGKFLGIHDVSAKRYIDLFKPDTKKGLYAFSKPITPEIVNTILSNPLKLKPQTQPVYVYDSSTLELINNKPFNSIKEFSSIYKIAKHISLYYLDTEKTTLVNGKLCYLFRSEISNNLKQNLLAKAVVLNDLKLDKNINNED